MANKNARKGTRAFDGDDDPPKPPPEIININCLMQTTAGALRAQFSSVQFTHAYIHSRPAALQCPLFTVLHRDKELGDREFYKFYSDSMLEVLLKSLEALKIFLKGV